MILKYIRIGIRIRDAVDETSELIASALWAPLIFSFAYPRPVEEDVRITE